MLAGLEALARARFGPAAETPGEADAEWLVPDPVLGWERKPGYSGEVYGALRTFDRSGRFPEDESDLRTRSGRLLWLLGDSRTFGNGVELGETYAERQQELPGGLRAVNLAVPGYSLVQGALALRQGFPAAPGDVVVFAFGFNDRRYVLDPDDQDSERFFRWRSYRGRFFRLVRRSRLLGLVLAEPEPANADRHGGVDLRGVTPRVPVSRFRQLLERVVAESRARGLRPTFLILPDNSEQVADLAVADRLSAAGRRRRAQRLLNRVVAADSAFSDLARLRLVELYSKSGREDLSAQIAASPRRLESASGGYPIVDQSPYDRAVTETASALGVPVIDGHVALDGHPEMYLDFCHLRPSGYAAIARLLARELGAAGDEPNRAPKLNAR